MTKKKGESKGIECIVNYDVVQKKGIHYGFAEHSHVICTHCGNIDYMGGQVYSVCTSKPALILTCGQCGKETTVEWVKIKKRG